MPQLPVGERLLTTGLGGFCVAVAFTCFYGLSDSDKDGVLNLFELQHYLDNDNDGQMSSGEAFNAAVFSAGFMGMSLGVAQGILIAVGFVIFVVQARAYTTRMQRLLSNEVFEMPTESTKSDDPMLLFLHNEFGKGVCLSAEPLTPASRNPRRSRSKKDTITRTFFDLSPQKRNRADSVTGVLPSDEIFSQLANGFHDWNFDMFRVAKATEQPLTFTGFVCLDAYSLTIQPDKAKLLEFLGDAESGYRKVPYHNSLHGATVGRCVSWFCESGGLDGALSVKMQFALVLAGLVHDIHHPGLTASFLNKVIDKVGTVSIKPPLEKEDMQLSIKYNDQSPLENMHAAITFDLLRKEKNAFIGNELISEIRGALVRAILGTDMAKHAETMARLDMLIDNLKNPKDAAKMPWYWPNKPPGQFSEAQKAAWKSKVQEEFVMELFLHAADIGTPSMPFEQFRQWNKLVQQEFVNQGDLEKTEFGALISPSQGFDRNASEMDVHSFTAGFITFLSRPLFQKLHELTQIDDETCHAWKVDISPCLKNLEENVKLWAEIAPAVSS